MKRKLKAAGRVIIIFVVVMLVGLAPTFMFWTVDEIIFLFQKPGYWVWSGVLTIITAWKIFQAEKNSNK